jgi:ribosomal protein L37E
VEVRAAELMSDPPRLPFTCPQCSARSFNQNDARERYCGSCGFVDEPFDRNGMPRVWPEEAEARKLSLDLFQRLAGAEARKLSRDLFQRLAKAQGIGPLERSAPTDNAMAMVERIQRITRLREPDPSLTPLQSYARRVLCCALTFQEGCPDTTVHGHEPWACEPCTAVFLKHVEQAGVEFAYPGRKPDE